MNALANPVDGSPPSTDAGIRLQLIGGFSVRDGESHVAVPGDAQRLIAFLAIRRRRLPRTMVAESLWLDNSSQRAHGNLRSALWRVRKKVGALVESDTDTLGIAAAAQVDIDTLAHSASRLTDFHTPCSAHDLTVGRYRGELLPGWYDDWVVVERERVRQLSLHSLEAITRRLIAAGHHGAAAQAAIAAIEVDPLRESAHRCLVQVHLAEGNRSEALRQFEFYRNLLWDELGFTPSQQMIDLINSP